MKRVYKYGFLGIVFLASSALVHAAAEREDALRLHEDLKAACAEYDYQAIGDLMDSGAPENMDGHSLLGDYILGCLPEDVAVVELFVLKGANLKQYGDGILMLALQTEEPLEQKKAKLTAVVGAGARTSFSVIQKNVRAGLVKSRAAQQRGMWQEGLFTLEEWRELVQVIVDNAQDLKGRAGIVDYLMQEHKSRM